MAFYHCSPTAGLTLLRPGKPLFSEKPAMVYMTTLYPMALMYGIQNYEYTYGYTREGQIYLDEYFPNALAVLYQGKSASMYLCNPEKTATTRIPNEVVSPDSVPVLKEERIEDVYQALLEQERLGALVIRRYSALPQETKDWIRKVEADTIRQNLLLHTPGPMADYYRTHYPESWEMVEKESSPT